jgi:hypothetical protein
MGIQFSPDMLALVLAGKKTQTRRPVKPGDLAVWQEVPYPSLVSVSRNGVLKWRVGQSYAIQPGRGKHAVARLTILDIRRERVNDILQMDAIAEGFPNRDAFFDKWRALYGDNTDLTAPCWALTFQLTGD